jgi:hypothetical protein
MARPDSSPRCNVAVPIGGQADMQIVIRGNHIGVDDPLLPRAANIFLSANLPLRPVSSVIHLWSDRLN